MAIENVEYEKALTWRSAGVALVMVLLWTLGSCFLAVYAAVHMYQLLMVLVFGAILTILLVRYGGLFLMALGVCWVGAYVGMRYHSGAGPADMPRINMGILRSLPILLGLTALAFYLWRRPLARGELAVVYASVLIAIPWCICIKALLESCAGNLFEIQLRSEKILYEWATELPWWGPTISHPGVSGPAPEALAAIQGYAHGNGGNVPWSLWWRPILYWTAMCACFEGMLMGLTLMFRRRWVEQERLPFVWAQPAITIIGTDSDHAGSRRKWIWFAIGLALCVPAVLMVSPTSLGEAQVGVPPWAGRVEGLRGGVDLTGLNLLPGVPLELFWGPMVLTFLLLFPVDVLLTVALTYSVLFILLPGIMRTMGAQVGPARLAEFQKWGLRFGGCIGLVFWSIWFNRGRIWGYIRSAWGAPPWKGEPEDELHRPVVLAITVIGTVGFIVLGCYATTLVQMICITLLVLAYAFSLLRQRAEGQMVTYENNIGSHQMVSIQRDFLQDHRNLPVPTTTGSSWATHWMVWAFVGQLKSYGPHVMLLEAFKVGHEMRVHAATIAKVVLVTMLIVAAVTPVLYLQLMYTYGYNNSFQGRMTWSGTFTNWSERSASYSIHSTSHVFWLPGEGFYEHYRNIFNIFYGVVIIGVLFYMRREFPRFWLSPVGVVIAADLYKHQVIPFSPRRVWFSFLIIWAVKSLIFRWLGVRSFREKVQPVVVMLLCGMIFGMMMYISRYISLGFGSLK